MYITEFNTGLVIATCDNVVLFNPGSGDSKLTKVPPPEVPPNLTEGQLEVLNKQDRSISAIATSTDDKLLAVATENKQLVIFDSDLNVTKNFIVTRAASALAFTSLGDILVADRTGDVYLYQLGPGNSQPTLMLGHLSMILDMVLSRCEKYIITCDRDEKIRVSHFPEAYDIESFCLGHEEFVTSIKLVRNILVSASGDGTIMIWDYVKGEQLSVIDTNQYVFNNEEILETLQEIMDKEKVDVTVLPITDMQVGYKDEDHFNVAVSLYEYPMIQVYTIDINTYKSTMTTISGVSQRHKFYLRKSDVYVFYDSAVTLYNCDDEDDTWHHVCNLQLENFQKSYRDILKITNQDVTVLYKRKYDNVQEYLEKKKLRLTSEK